MKLAITLLGNSADMLGGKCKVKDNFYFGSKELAGTVVSIKEDDNWLDGELAWVSRSEIPFITAIRLSQVSDDANDSIWGINPNPIITRYGTDHGIFSLSKKEVFDKFPSESECITLLRKEAQKAPLVYSLSDKTMSPKEIRLLYNSFDYANDLLIRAGACLHKAHLLESTSYMFAEEIYVNLYIAFEAIIEYQMQKYGKNRQEVLHSIDSIPGTGNFLDYEEEMRDMIRNNIIHPWRKTYKESVVQPMASVEYIFEDLPFIDWLFRRTILGKV